jgi:octaprenyl-diphosphate synthase
VRTVDRREQADADFDRARELIRQSGALDATLDLARQFAGSAKAALADGFGSNSWRPALQDLADFAVLRTA